MPRLRRFAFTVSAFALLTATGCAGSSSEPPTDDTESSLMVEAPAGCSGECAVKHLVDHAPRRFSASYGDALVKVLLREAITTSAIKTINAFAGKHIDGPSAGERTEPFERLGNQMAEIYWSTPRDLTSEPAGLGGQSFTATATIDRDGGDLYPIHLRVVGAASVAYKLTFMVANHKMSVDVPMGATAKDTAALVAKKLTSDNRAIMNTYLSDQGFAKIGGNHTGYSGFDDYEIQVGDDAGSHEDVVVLAVAING